MVRGNLCPGSHPGKFQWRILAVGQGLAGGDPLSLGVGHLDPLGGGATAGVQFLS